MIFRAIFWIGLVALLMPHEPDLGFGRPGANPHANPPSSIGALIQSTNLPKACTGSEVACVGGLSLFDRVRAVMVRNLDQVRADIEAHRHEPPHGI
jgi:hypothetical protein